MALFLMVLLAWFLGDSGESEYRLLCLVTRVTMRSFVHLIRLITLSFLPSLSRYQTPTMFFLKQNCKRMTEIVDQVTPRILNNYHKLVFSCSILILRISAQGNFYGAGSHMS